MRQFTPPECVSEFSFCFYLIASSIGYIVVYSTFFLGTVLEEKFAKQKDHFEDFLYSKTRCQLKWKMQGQNHQFSKCYFFHIQSFQSLFICINRWYLIFFYKIFNVDVIRGPESFLPFLPSYPENGHFWAKNVQNKVF